MSSIFLCSLDSLFAALAIGAVGVSKHVRHSLIATFAIGDSVATLLGSALHLSVRLPDVDGLLTILVLSTAILCLAATAWSRRFSAALGAIPILLSLDNVITALRDAAVPVVGGFLLAGATSGLFAWAGFSLAQFLKSGLSDVKGFRRH
jgi:hypothetical protein